MLEVIKYLSEAFEGLQRRDYACLIPPLIACTRLSFVYPHLYFLKSRVSV